MLLRLSGAIGSSCFQGRGEWQVFAEVCRDESRTTRDRRDDWRLLSSRWWRGAVKKLEPCGFQQQEKGSRFACRPAALEVVQCPGQGGWGAVSAQGCVRACLLSLNCTPVPVWMGKGRRYLLEAPPWSLQPAHTMWCLLKLEVLKLSWES